MALYRADVDVDTYYPVNGLFVTPGQVVDVPPSDAKFCEGLTLLDTVEVPEPNDVDAEVVVEAVSEPVSDSAPVLDSTTTDAPAPVVDVPVASVAESTPVEPAPVAEAPAVDAPAEPAPVADSTPVENPVNNSEVTNG